MKSKLLSYGAMIALIIAIVFTSDTINIGSSIADSILGGVSVALTVLFTKAATIETIREEKRKIRA